MITAPFNFVPLSEKVFFPDWSEDISHDVPFADGESGVIDITITAKSPIFIRDGQEKTQFCNHNGEYYIPGSSIKGMVRNVLEIMSFSKMSDESFDDNTYAVRDLSKADNFYMKEMNKDIFCGWLKKVGDKYIIEDCDIPGRLHQKQIDYALNTDFAKYFNSHLFKPQNKDHKTSKYKYDLVAKKDFHILLSEPYKSTTNAKYDKRMFYKYDKNGTNKGTLVLTGQPTQRKDTGKMGDGKGFEFIFFDSKREIAVSEKVWENFKFAYFDKRTTEPKESKDWTYWKEKLEMGGKVPVFFQKNGNAIQHFGLSYLYKLPYSHSIKDGIPKEHFTEKLDLSQTIFGHIDSINKTALKGRVQFSHFKSDNASCLSERTEILGTPRASYYPIYVKQYEKKLFTTYMDSNFSIAGRKCYPIHKGKQTQKTEDTGNENVGTKFSPLKEGAVFRGKLRYHNLKKSELGALLSALTFHNTDDCFHNIGLAKALGYGKIELKLTDIKNLESYLKEFELQIGEQIEDWSNSKQITEFFTMSTEQDNSGNSKLSYMSLQSFADNKSKTKDYLRAYSQLENIKSVQPKSLISEEEKKEFDSRRETHLKAIEVNKLKKEEAIRLEKEAQKEKEKQQREAKQKLEKEEREADKAREESDKQAKIKAIEDAKKADEEAKKRQRLSAGIDFSNANDHKGIERAIKGHEKTEDNIALLEACIKNIYKDLNKKKKGQFARSKDIGKWLGKDRFDELLKSLG